MNILITILIVVVAVIVVPFIVYYLASLIVQAYYDTMIRNLKKFKNEKEQK